MKVNAPKQTLAQQHAREASLLSELQANFGYMLVDSLPAKDRSSMLATRTLHKGKRTLVLDLAYAIKLLVPSRSVLGKRIAADRKERDPATSKVAMQRVRERAKARLAKGPR